MSKYQTTPVNVNFDVAKASLIRIISLIIIGVVTSSVEQIVDAGRSILFLLQITIKKIFTF